MHVFRRCLRVCEREAETERERYREGDLASFSADGQAVSGRIVPFPSRPVACCHGQLLPSGASSGLLRCRYAAADCHPPIVVKWKTTQPLQSEQKKYFLNHIPRQRLHGYKHSHLHHLHRHYTTWHMQPLVVYIVYLNHPSMAKPWMGALK